MMKIIVTFSNDTGTSCGMPHKAGPNIKLPGTNAGLHEIFRNAAAPDISEFNGEYLVDMLTNFPSLKRLSHRKVFYHEDGKVMGYNLLFGRKWGIFSVLEGTCGMPVTLKTAVLNYDRKENPFFIRKIRDHVRRIEKDVLYVGRFNHLFSGRLYFLGYFSLEKLK